MGEQRRTATLLAAARQLETAAGDDALDLLDQFLGGILARAGRAGIRERLRTLPALDLAAAQLRDAVKVLLDPPAGGLAASGPRSGARCPVSSSAPQSRPSTPPHTALTSVDNLSRLATEFNTD
jgi:hypothetical protein